MRNIYIYKKIRKSKGERPLGKRRYSWDDNVKTDLMETECNNMNWIHLLLGYGPGPGSCEQSNEPWVPQKLENYLAS
jgi:hypothetical protein